MEQQETKEQQKNRNKLE